MRERGAALSGFVRVLCANPTGDAAARAAVLGALAPLGAIAAQIYGSGRPGTLELLGNFGWPPADAAAFRALPASVPLPITDAFSNARASSTPWNELIERYPVLAPSPDEQDSEQVTATARDLVVCVPIVWSEAPVGVLLAVLAQQPHWGPDEWQYVDGVAGALALWMLEQRRALIDGWRKAAPMPHADIAISPTQHKILEMVGDGRTDAEIAKELGLSVSMIRQDIHEVMRLMGTEDRRTAAGRAREVGLLPDRRTRDGAT